LTTRSTPCSDRGRF